MKVICFFSLFCYSPFIDRIATKNNHFQNHFFSLFQVDVLKTKLWIEFDGEVGLDYGGVARFEIMPVIVMNVILLVVMVVKSLLY